MSSMFVFHARPRTYNLLGRDPPTPCSCPTQLEYRLVSRSAASEALFYTISRIFTGVHGRYYGHFKIRIHNTFWKESLPERFARQLAETRGVRRSRGHRNPDMSAAWRIYSIRSSLVTAWSGLRSFPRTGRLCMIMYELGWCSWGRRTVRARIHTLLIFLHLGIYLSCFSSERKPCPV